MHNYPHVSKCIETKLLNNRFSQFDSGKNPKINVQRVLSIIYWKDQFKKYESYTNKNIMVFKTCQTGFLEKDVQNEKHVNTNVML